jgi:hypothetical protein
MKRTGLAAAIVLVTVLMTAAVATAGSGWVLETAPSPPGSISSVFADVSCTSAANCIAVGTGDTTTGTFALAERWNGSKWTVQATPAAADASLGGVSCSSPSSCTAVGSYRKGSSALTLAERWDGARWTIQTTPNRAGSTHNSFHAVSCPTATSCMAVGMFLDPIAKYYRPLVEHWNGSTWAIQTTPSPSTLIELSGVSCTSASACTAVFDTIAERWNGTTWTVQTLAKPGGVSKVSCASSTACTAVGYHAIPSEAKIFAVIERWNGSSWAVQQTPNVPNSSFYGVSCMPTNGCTAVGYHNSTGPNVALVEHWNGTTWTVQPAPNPTGADGSLFSVSCTTGTACTAVGDYENSTLNHFPFAEQHP